MACEMQYLCNYKSSLSLSPAYISNGKVCNPSVSVVCCDVSFFDEWIAISQILLLLLGHVNWFGGKGEWNSVSYSRGLLLPL